MIFPEIGFFFRDPLCKKALQLLLSVPSEDPLLLDCRIYCHEHPEIIENYDYWSVPSLFIDHDKIFEAALFMPYETVKEGVKLAFDKALEG